MYRLLALRNLLEVQDGVTLIVHDPNGVRVELGPVSDAGNRAANRRLRK